MRRPELSRCPNRLGAVGSWFRIPVVLGAAFILFSNVICRGQDIPSSAIPEIASTPLAPGTMPAEADGLDPQSRLLPALPEPAPAAPFVRDSLFTDPDPPPTAPIYPEPARRGWFGLPPIEELLDDRYEDKSTYFPEADNDPRQPDIRKPGPDTANFPNSPYTIRRGRFYVEVSPLILSGPSSHQAPMYNAEALFRFGLTDRTEFRIFTNGLTAFRKYRRQPASTGFAPLAFDFKTNFFKENRKYLIPGIGLETFLQTNTGSAGFNQNTQVGINLLFDHTLPFEFLFEWNIGLASDPDIADTEVFELVLQWALQREIVEGFDVFYHGFLNGSPTPRAGDGIVMGGGAIWAPNRRIAIWGSYNAGVTPDAPTTFTQIGLALAF